MSPGARVRASLAEDLKQFLSIRVECLMTTNVQGASCRHKTHMHPFTHSTYSRTRIWKQFKILYSFFIHSNSICSCLFVFKYCSTHNNKCICGHLTFCILQQRIYSHNVIILNWFYFVFILIVNGILSNWRHRLIVNAFRHVLHGFQLIFQFYSSVFPFVKTRIKISKRVPKLGRCS